MGYLCEIAMTVPAFAKPACHDAHPPQRTKEPAAIPFDPGRQQRCVLWEPDEILHAEPVLYFYGSVNMFGPPESMADATNANNSQRCQFCSVGLREVPWRWFPAMVDDGFLGAKAALAHMERAGIPCGRIAA